MEYFKEVATGRFNPPYTREVITREQAVMYLGEKKVAELEKSKTIDVQSSTSIRTIGGTWVGVAY